MPRSTRILRRLIGLSVFTLVLITGLVAAWWIHAAVACGDQATRPAPPRVQHNAPLDIIAAWHEGRALLATGDFAKARRLADRMIQVDPEAREGRRLLVQWAFAVMAGATGADVFNDALTTCLAQADHLAVAGAEAEAHLIRACCANARGVYLERTSNAAKQAAGHFDRARMHAEAALAADPTLHAAEELIARLASL